MAFEIDAKSARLFAKMGPRATYGSLMYGFVRDGHDFVALSADLGRSSGLERFRQEFPDRFFNVGIAEQSMVAIAAGMAREGNTVFASSFAPFISMRASEHIRVNLSYMREPVNLVGLGSGFSLGFLGNTHYGIEDLAVLNTLPNMTILCPADAGSVGKAIINAADIDGPVYIRLTGSPGLPSVYQSDYDYDVGKLNLVGLPGRHADVAIVGCGSILSECVVAQSILKDAGTEVDIYDCHTFKPFDVKGALTIFEKYRLVVSVEEHALIGGLYSVLAGVKAMSDQAGCILRGLGVNDKWVDPGERDYVLDQLELNSKHIASKISVYLND